MKRVYTIVLVGSLFCISTILLSQEKVGKKDDFLRINPNIQNEELRAELEELRKKFDNERVKIIEIYKDKIEALKSERKNKVKTLKNEFAERRELLLKKYPPKKGKRSKGEGSVLDSGKTKPELEKKKMSKDKKRIQKP